jgi:hypothetical protein
MGNIAIVLGGIPTGIIKILILLSGKLSIVKLPGEYSVPIS